MNSLRRTAISLLQWGIGIGALAWALSDVDLAILRQTLGSYTLAAMMPVFFFALIDYLILGQRLNVLLPREVGYRRSLAATILGTGMNCVLPAKAGDALKIVYLTRETPYSLVEISSVIIWDRLLDIICLGTLLLFSWTQVGGQELNMGLSVPVAVLCGGVLGFFSLRHWSGFFHSLYARFLPGRLASPLSRLHTSLIDQISVPWVARGMVCSIGTWGTYFLSFYFTVGPMGELGLTVPQMVVVFTVSTLGTAIPSLPGGIGLFEGAMVLSLSWFGVDSTSALGLALFFHAVHFIPLAVCAILINGRVRYWDRPKPASPDAPGSSGPSTPAV
ncbi:MAG: lysylphosphatidylglycerol synthase transmembrane domain-containing protein [Desulfovibrionaceae bacterium]|nr:lysylphosphatidylglycerol synthase transmembrane domain-containing protein [Desulfovibrionaceae bacterium]